MLKTIYNKNIQYQLKQKSFCIKDAEAFYIDHYIKPASLSYGLNKQNTECTDNKGS